MVVEGCRLVCTGVVVGPSHPPKKKAVAAVVGEG